VLNRLAQVVVVSQDLNEMFLLGVVAVLVQVKFEMRDSVMAHSSSDLAFEQRNSGEIYSVKGPGSSRQDWVRFQASGMRLEATHAFSCSLC